MKKVLLGFLLLALGYTIAFYETRYFDYNGHPYWAASPAEWVLDLVSLLISFLGTIIVLREFNKIFKNRKQQS